MAMQDCWHREIDYLRLSVTELCNLRCRYCMPPEGVCKKRHEDMLSEEEMAAAVSAAAELGIRKVRITGGEPLVKKNLLSICERIGGIPGVEPLCLTTNGTLLAETAKELVRCRVSRINISLDTLQEDRYRYLTRRGELRDALAGIDAALAAGFEKVKINVVLLGGVNDDEAPALAALTRRIPADVRFIEWMPMYDSGDFGPETQYSCRQAFRKIEEQEGKLLSAADDGGVAKLFRFPDAKGNVGFITPVSAHFCAACRRLRLSADGKLKPCLHSSEEWDIRGLPPEEMKQRIREAILAKPAAHGELSVTHRSQAGRTMNQIGG